MTRDGGGAATVESARPPASDVVIRSVEARITSVLAEQAVRWRYRQPRLDPLFAALESFVAAGGKRLRPLFCYWAAVGAGADPDDRRLVDVAAALELFHAVALIHDDVMDASDTRRGRPSVHRRFQAMHEVERLRGDGARFGEGLAILAGDLAFVLADVLLAEIPPAAREVWNELRVELTMGQWVDVVAAACGDRSTETARWIAAYKSGRYTVERPMHLGAALADRPDLCAGFSAIGEPLGQAFQLRDDLLGVVGDPAQTGKPVGADLRDGKATLLLAFATALADDTGRRQLARIGAPDLGDDELDELRELLVRCGAIDAVEHEIEALVNRAQQALERCSLHPPAGEALRGLCELACHRRC